MPVGDRPITTAMLTDRRKPIGYDAEVTSGG